MNGARINFAAPFYFGCAIGSAGLVAAAVIAILWIAGVKLS